MRFPSGLVDRSRVTVVITGPDLDPEEVSRALGAPTRSHRRGDLRPSGRPWDEGLWQHTVEGDAPEGPDDLARRLLDRLPADPDLWAGLRARHQVRLAFAVDLERQNRGFALSPAVVARIAALGVEVVFDLWSYGEG